MNYRPKVFASAPAKAIFVRPTSDGSGSTSFPATMGGDEIELVTTAQPHVRYLTRKLVSGLNVTRYR
jgi:hypothetical protein